jgi:beta-phosphoglucomutase
MIDAIIFDAEGVVVDTERAWDRSQEAFLARRGLSYDRQSVKPLLTGRSLQEGTAVLKQLYGLADGIAELAVERRELTAAYLGTEVHFVPGFEDFFRRVSGAYKTALATSMEQHLFELVDQRLGLEQLFRGCTFTLQDVGYKSKPAPDLFLHAAKQLTVSPERCVVIEDSPYGLQAARRAGMKSIGLATTYEPLLLGEADVVVQSYADIDLDAFFNTCSADSNR